MIILWPPVFFDITPTPEHCRFGIGCVSKGLTILRVLISLPSSLSIICGCWDAKAKFLEMRWHLSKRATLVNTSFTQLGSVWNFNSFSNCCSKGVITCSSCSLEGHLLAGCSPPQPLVLQTCLNLHTSPLVQPLVALKEMQISAPVDVHVCDSVCGWAKTWQDGWFAIMKIVARFCGTSQSSAGWFGREAPDKYVVFVLIPENFLVFRCKHLRWRSYSMHASAA